VKLNNGVEMPVPGFGVFEIPADQTAQAVSDARETDYRSLDTARSYMNEEAVGSAIAASQVPASFGDGVRPASDALRRRHARSAISPRLFACGPARGLGVNSRLRSAGASRD
jgi:hypothetical protein